MQKRHWKIVEGREILCNWVITFNDKDIWEKRDNDDAIYIHRICTNKRFRGNRYIDHIVKWSIDFAKNYGKRFVRLDTLGNNLKLINHYTSAGFEFLGIYRISNTSMLPKHYQAEPNCCLFQLDVQKYHSLR